MCGGSVVYVINDWQAIGVLERVQQQNYAYCWIKWVAGVDMDDWLSDFLEEVEKTGALWQCSTIEFNGRLGYIRKFGKRHPDYKVEQILVRKRI